MAGVSTKTIKSRIRSMESTKQITKAMEMVAASKLRHAQAQIENSRPYFGILYGAIRQIVKTNQEISSPYLTSHSGGKIGYIVIAGDRGLAGGYNGNIIKLFTQEVAGKDVEVLPIGKKTVDYFRSHGVSLVTDAYADAEEVSIGDCFTAAKLMCRLYLDGTFSEIHVIYTNFVSMLSQTAASMQLLPLLPEKEGAESANHLGIEYESGSETVFEAIIPEYIGGLLYGTLCESRASEQAARRAAMDSATQNAEDMISDLSLKFNRARQAAITQEITEIVAGS